MAQKVLFNAAMLFDVLFCYKGRKRKKQNTFSDITETEVVQNLTATLIDAPGTFDHFIIGLNSADMKKLGLVSGDYIKLIAKKGKYIVAIADGDVSAAQGSVRIPSAARINLR